MPPAAPAPGSAAGASVPVVAPPQFEVMYLLTGVTTTGVEVLRARLEQLGESVAIAASGAEGRYSVHVHADDAGAAVEAGLDVGTPSRIQITALTGAAPALRRAGPATARCWPSSTATARRNCSRARAPTCCGRTPARRSAPSSCCARWSTPGAAQIMVLPNGYVAAEELVAGCTAAIGWGIDVVPVPAGSMVQGLAALAVHDPARQAVDDGYTMARAAAGARHGVGAGGHRGGADVGGHLHDPVTGWASPATRC